MNVVHVLVSNSGQLFHIDINRDWSSSKAETLVSDNEPGLTSAVCARNNRLCILNALKCLLFTLWGDGMSKGDGSKVETAVKQTLFTW
jgi:hypothetical protein